MINQVTPIRPHQNRPDWTSAMRQSLCHRFWNELSKPEHEYEYSCRPEIMQKPLLAKVVSTTNSPQMVGVAAQFPCTQTSRTLSF
jgi:hypothetical protein